MLTKKTLYFLMKFLVVLLTVCFIPILVTCFRSVSTTYNSVWPLIPIILSSILLFVLLSTKYVTKMGYSIILLTLAFGVRIYWIHHIHTLLYSDYKIMYDAAIRAARGDFGFTSEGEYFFRWAYQLGHTMHQALLLHLFGGGTYTLKLFNIFYSTGTTFMIYLSARKLFNEPCGRIAGILYALYIPSIAMSSVLTNEHLATFLFYSAFYLLLRYFQSNRFIWILIGVLFSLGDIIRPLGSFILLAVGVYVFVFHFLENRDKQGFLLLGKFVGILFVFFLTSSLINSALIENGVTKYTLKNRDPLWKFVTGLNFEENGIYSFQDAQYLQQFKLGEDRNKASIELIQERIADKPKLFTLFKNKFIYMWTFKDGSLIWGLRSKEYDYLQLLNTLNQFEQFMYTSMSFFILIASIFMVMKRNMNPQVSMFLFLILGYMWIHLLIEVQTRYRYFIMPSFVIIQSYGVYSLYHFFRKMLFWNKNYS